MTQQLPSIGVRFGRLPSAILCALLLVSLFAPATIHVLGLSTDARFIDNRPPKPFPVLPRSLGDLPRFHDGVTQFIDDRFGLRAELIRLNMGLYHHIGVSKNPNLFVGKSGWTYLREDKSGFGIFRGLNRFTSQELDRWIDIMEMLQRWVALHDAQFIVVVAPNQQTIYPEYMPNYVTRVNPETRLDQLVRRLRERASPLLFVDPRPDLWDARRKVPVYRRYENHWNPIGALVAYRAIMRIAAGRLSNVQTLELADFEIRPIQYNWPVPPFKEVDPELTLKSGTNVTSIELAATINEEHLLKVSTRLRDAPSVLLYGDSFSIRLSDVIEESSSWSMYVPSGRVLFPFGLVEKHKPKLVVYEIVERFLANYLPDQPHAERDLLLKEAPPLSEVLSRRGMESGGAIESAAPENDMVTFPGWAVDPIAKVPTSVIYAYRGSRVVGAAVSKIRRPDLAANYANDMLAFRLSVPRSEIGDEPLRFFGVNPDGSTRELTIIPQALAAIEKLKLRPSP